MPQWLTNFQNNLRAERTLLVIVVALFCTVLYLYGHNNPSVNTYEAEMKTWKARAELAEHHNDSLRAQNALVTHFVDSVKVEVAARDKQIHTLEIKVNTVRKKNDSTLAQLTKTLPDTCKSALTLAENYRAESDSNAKLFTLEKTNSTGLKKSVDSLTTSNTKLSVQNDSLIKLLRTVPVYHEPKMLGLFPLPSRKTSFVIGGVVGAAVTTAIVVALHH